MNKNIPFVAVTTGHSRLLSWLPLAALLLSANSWAECIGGHDIPISCPTSLAACSYATTINTTITTQDIAVTGAAGNVYWDLAPSAGCSGSESSINCLGMTATLPAGAPASAVAQTETVKLSGTAQGVPGESGFTLTVTDEVDGSKTCSRTYNPRITALGGGWGDPHITTVNGVNYDFQSAGEFVSLIGDDLQVQTRQTPIQTTSAPELPNQYTEYTGLSTCVSIYTAVAARVGSHQVSFQPGINGEPSPEGLILYIDGLKTELGPDGINLGDTEGSVSAHIFKTASGGIEIDYSTGTKLVATPAWWAGMNKWYLNVNVYDTTASQGVMGATTNNWLPALRNGESLGAKPERLHDRYVQLNKTFADSWRVKAAESMFVYAEGTSTSTFTYSDWPRESPKSCLLDPGPGQPDPGPVVTPIDQAVAEQECAAVTDENLKANCIFDVTVTGHKGFATAYVAAQKEAPGATKTTVKADSGTSGPGKTVTFTAMVEREVPKPDGVPTGVVQFIIDGSNAGEPVKLDATGKAVYSTANLALGAHKVVAKFTYPGGFGEVLRGSTSAPMQHVVAETNWIWWLIILIIILLIAFLLWRKYGKS